jgi:hypothetical protein
MSINEHRHQNVSFNWTPRQKQEAEAACYGFRPEDLTMLDIKFSEEEIQNMRTLIAQHDKQGIREFDLNNPPKKPYTHQEYPKMMYKHATGEHRVADTVEAEEAAVEAGWSTSSVPVPETQSADEEHNEPTERPKGRRR